MSIPSASLVTDHQPVVIFQAQELLKGLRGIFWENETFLEIF